MAVYKPTYCYPYLESVDLTIPDGEKYFTCQIDTSNIKISGYRVELYNENNEKVFPLNEGKISPLSELNDTDGTLGLNGSELRFPFVQHWGSKIYPSYNAIYFKATNYVDYYQKVNESINLERARIENGCLSDSNGDPIFIDGSPLFVGDVFLLVNKLYKVTLDGAVEDSLGTNAIVYVKGGDANAGKILQYTDGTFGESSSGAWCDISEKPLAISNNGKTYKWQITLYSGERGAIRTTGANGAVEISYDSMADNEFNTVLTSGTILGSTADRIQGPISDKIYAKQWLQLLRKNDKGDWLQVGTRTYIESYSQSLGHIYPVSGDSRGFKNDDLKGENSATHFAVYKYSNEPNHITSQDSVDQAINFKLTDFGATYVEKNYFYTVTGKTREEALANIANFNKGCDDKGTTQLCELDKDGNALHAGESLLIWNSQSPDAPKNLLTGYFTIQYSNPEVTYTIKNEDGTEEKRTERIPQFTFDMVYAYRKVSSYIGKVFFVKEGSFANENIVSKAKATGVNDVVSLGAPIIFTEEEPLEIYPDAEDKFHGEIFKNEKGKVYVSPFVGLQAGARLYVSDGSVIKATSVDSTTWAVEYNTPQDRVYFSIDPLKYEIRTNFKSSDETPFYAYDTPRLVPWSEQALSVVGATGYEFLLEFMGQILTVPIIFSSEIHARYVHVTGQYLQAQNVSWTSYRWLLVDEYGQVIQDTGKQYDGLIETTFYGLNGPTVDAVEKGKAVPTAYYPVLIVEDELGNSLIMGMKIEVSLNPRNLPMEFSGSFDCKTQSVIMKIKDYGYPKFSQDADNKATVLSTSEGVSYQITASQGGGTPAPVNPIKIGDTITKLYFNTSVTPDIGVLKAAIEADGGYDEKGGGYAIMLVSGHDVMLIPRSDETPDVFSICYYNAEIDRSVEAFNGETNSWTEEATTGFSGTVEELYGQSAWGAYISKDGQWKSDGSEVKILGLDQQGQLSSWAADQVKIPTQGAQLKHFFAKDTTEIPDLSKAPKKLATNNKGNIEFHTKVKLDANFCGEILKYSVDIFDTFGNTDKLNILLELPNNFKNAEHVYNKLEPSRNQVKCVVSARGFSASASGIALFTLPNKNQEAYYLQPEDWINKNGDIKDSDRQSLEYLDFVHPFNASGTEQEDYTNINESINIKEDENGVSRDVGVCCLQQANATTGNNLFNKWTDLKRIKVITPAGPRVVQTAEPAKWQDTDDNGALNIWTEGWNDDYDTKMVQVKRHAEVDDASWRIDGYLRGIDALYGQSLKMDVSSDVNSSVWKVYKETQFNGDTLVEGEEPYITIQMKKEA